MKSIAKPTWPSGAVAILAGLGVLLTGYITWAKLNTVQLAACTEGGGCDLVLQSNYASLFGVPLSAFGLGLYLALGLVAILPGLDRWRWQLLFGLSLVGVTFSAYLVYLLVFEIATFCLYCTASVLLMSSIFVLTLFAHRWEKPDLLVIGGLGVVLVAMAGSYGVFTLQSVNASGTVDYSTALAKHLRDGGAKMYGASWCSHCENQKALFGDAERFVPYVECSPGGSGTPLSQACSAAGIESFPTWDINGQRYTGEQPLAELAKNSGFPTQQSFKTSASQ